MNNQKNTIIAISVLIIVFVLLISFVPKKELVIKSFEFADEVDDQLNYLPNDGSYFEFEEIYFVTEFENLDTRENQISYSVEAEIFILKSEGKKELELRERIIEETIPNKTGEISVVGTIEPFFSVPEGNHLLIITVTDNYSGKIKRQEKTFKVREWPLETLEELEIL